MLNKNNIVIFSPPRTGTKLLANILDGFGYYVHGEWYSLMSTTIENNKAIRRTQHITTSMFEPEKQFKRLQEHIRRHTLYQEFDKNVITIWLEALMEFPFILDDLNNYHWLCLRRDPWEQILSFYISAKNTNFDGLYQSKPVIFNEPFFKKLYWDYYKTYELQDWLLKNKSAELIQFNDLISGESTVFGQPYIVESKDECTDLESLVINIQEVKEWFKTLEISRLDKNNIFTVG